MRARRFIGSLVGLALTLGGCLPRAARAAEAEALAELTRRWTGATCVLRLALPIKQEKDPQGWSHSPNFMVALEGEKPFHLRLRISDLAALRARVRADEVPPGTVLLVEGWRAERWGAFGGYVVDLRFRDLPLQGRFEFLAGRGFSLKPERLVDLERYLRIEACQVSFPAEALPARPASAAAPTARATGAPAAAPGPAPAYVPALRILAAAVQPARVRPGEEVALVVNYLLEGLPPGAGFEVHEERELLSGERHLTTLEDRVTRAAGTYTSSQRIRVPADLAPGVYRLRARVRVAGLAAEGEALFEVD